MRVINIATAAAIPTIAFTLNAFPLLPSDDGESVEADFDELRAELCSDGDNRCEEEGDEESWFDPFGGGGEGGVPDFPRPSLLELGGLGGGELLLPPLSLEGGGGDSLPSFDEEGGGGDDGGCGDCFGAGGGGEEDGGDCFGVGDDGEESSGGDGGGGDDSELGEGGELLGLLSAIS
ncbi:hypothetical protein L6164_031925 [Bauhinia variegata]|uniref:Uncharacterized protein n=1 Tax=Bauhinia variegata TaxID=167791 RepID=A0ACB9KM57_BAUVA|nr:hypothetical protein L6164_031925 [Bauhinia variegata]